MTKAPAGLVFPDVQEPDLFGDAYPSGYDPNAPTRPAGFASRATKEDRDGLFGDNPELTGSAKDREPKINRSYMIQRACAEAAKRFPGFYWKCEHQIVTFNGMTKTKDILGFMDAQGLTDEGRFVAIQVTTPGAVNKHISDYTNPLKTTGQGKVPIEKGLRSFLDRNGLFLMASYRREGSRWVFDFRIITHHDLDAAIARKRKPR